MVDNQHKLIKGYRDLSQEEIELMNKVKGLAEHVGEIVDLMNKHQTADQRWVNIARTDLQKGFMALIRSIAQPQSF